MRWYRAKWHCAPLAVGGSHLIINANQLFDGAAARLDIGPADSSLVALRLCKRNKGQSPVQTPGDKASPALQRPLLHLSAKNRVQAPRLHIQLVQAPNGLALTVRGRRSGESGETGQKLQA